MWSLTGRAVLMTVLFRADVGSVVVRLVQVVIFLLEELEQRLRLLPRCVACNHGNQRAWCHQRTTTESMFQSGIHKHEELETVHTHAQAFHHFFTHQRSFHLSTEKHTLLLYLWDMFCSSVLEWAPDRHRSVRDNPASYSCSSPSQTPSLSDSSAAQRVCVWERERRINIQAVNTETASELLRTVINRKTTVLQNSAVQFQR